MSNEKSETKQHTTSCVVRIFFFHTFYIDRTNIKIRILQMLQNKMFKTYNSQMMEANLIFIELRKNQ